MFICHVTLDVTSMWLILNDNNEYKWWQTQHPRQQQQQRKQQRRWWRWKWMSGPGIKEMRAGAQGTDASRAPGTFFFSNFFDYTNTNCFLITRQPWVSNTVSNTTNKSKWLVGGFSSLPPATPTTHESRWLVGGLHPFSNTTNESWRLVGGFWLPPTCDVNHPRVMMTHGCTATILLAVATTTTLGLKTHLESR